jgi:hypothetical protein
MTTLIESLRNLRSLFSIELGSGLTWQVLDEAITAVAERDRLRADVKRAEDIARKERDAIFTHNPAGTIEERVARLERNVFGIPPRKP